MANSHTEDFRSGIARLPWIKVVSDDGTGPPPNYSQINTLNGYAVSQRGSTPVGTANGNYLLYATESAAVTTIDNGANHRITWPAPHGWDPLDSGPPVVAADILTIAMEGNTDPDLNQVWPVQVSSTTTMDILGWNNSAVSSSATVYYNKKTGISDPNSIQQANVMSSAVGTNNYAMLWARLSAGGGPSTELKRGYGLRLWWEDATTRKLQIVRTDPLAGLGGLIVVAESDVSSNMLVYDGSDLSVTQRMVFIVGDNDPGIAGDPGSVLIRGYLNGLDSSGNVSLANPTVEYIDRGSGSAPIFHENGTWAITFGAEDQIFVDSWKGADNWTWPSSGVARAPQYSTLAELRTKVALIASRGVSTNLDATMVGCAINDAVFEVLNEFGDAATFMRQTATITFTDAGDNLLQVPGYVEKISMLWDTIHNAPVRFRWVDRDSDGNLLIAVDSPDTSFRVQYERVAGTMEAEDSFCPIPKRYDNLVRYIAASYLVEQRKNPDFYLTLMNTVRRLKDQTVAHLQRDRRMENPRLTVDLDNDDTILSAWDYRHNPIY